jgi:hypothetical protein
MSSISAEHGFWAKSMSNVIEQAKTDSEVKIIVKRLVQSTDKCGRDPCHAAAKGFRTNTFPDSAPFIDTSILGRKFPAKQSIFKVFFVQNPTPTRVEEIPDKDNDHVPKILVVSDRATVAQPPLKHDQQEFFKLMVKTMQKMQHAPLQGQTRIVVKSHDQEETINVAKLQNSMVRLMYTTTKTVNWDKGTIMSVSLATFTQEYQNLLGRSISVQVTQLSNLFRNIFPLNQTKLTTMAPPSTGLCFYVFPPKFTKGHLNDMFQSNNLELAAIYKSTSINPFHYAPQQDQILVAVAKKEVKEEQNEKSFAISESNHKKILSLIKGIGNITSMDNVAKTCANICGVQLAIVDIMMGKPLLYQYAWEMIRFIENKHFTCWHARNTQSLAHLPMLFVGKLHQFFQHLASFSQNSINTNLVKHGNHGKRLNIKSVSTAAKLASKFLKKMTEHMEDNTVLKEVPAFACTLFVEQPGGYFTNSPVIKKTTKTPAANRRGKKDGNKPKKKKQKREASDKSLKMSIFHIM